MGRRSLSRSQARRPGTVARNERAISMAATTPPSSAGHQSSMKRELPSRMRVISGSSARMFSNTLAKAGMTKRLITTTAATMARMTKLG